MNQFYTKNRFYDRKRVEMECFYVVMKEIDRYVHNIACHKASSHSHTYVLTIAFANFDPLLQIYRRHLKIMLFWLVKSNIYIFA